MKKHILVAVIISLLLFSFVVAEEVERGEVIGIDHETGIIAAIVEDVQEFSQGIFKWIDDLAKQGTEEVERRQEVIEDQIETRKENLFISIKNIIQDFINELVESIVDSLMAPFESLSQTGD